MSILDESKPTLDEVVWSAPNGLPQLNPKMDRAIKYGAIRIVGDVPVRGAYLVGSLAGYRYNDKSDMDVTVVISADDAKMEEIRDRTKKVNGRLAPGTQHPINYYIVNDLPTFTRFDSVYDLRQREWLKSPKDYGVDIFTVYDSFREYVAQIDSARSEAFRSILDIKTLYSALSRGSDPNIIGYKLIRRVKDLNSAIDDMLRVVEDDQKERVEAFRSYMRLADMGIKPLPSPNLLPENIRHKLLERYHYLDFLHKLREYMKRKDAVGVNDVGDVSDILERVLTGLTLVKSGHWKRKDGTLWWRNPKSGKIEPYKQQTKQAVKGESTEGGLKERLSKDPEWLYASVSAKMAIRELGANVKGVDPFGSYGKKDNPKDIDVLVHVDSLDLVLGKRSLAASTRGGKPIDIFVTDGKRTAVGEQVSPQEIKFKEVKNARKN